MSDASLEKTLTTAPGSSAAISRERREVLDDVYKNYWSELCRYINKTFGSGPPDPEDIVQQAFVSYALRDDAQKIDNPRAYLYRAAHNAVISEKRKAQTRGRYVSEGTWEIFTEKSCPLTGERVLLSKQQLQIVKEALLKMPRKRRRFLLLHRVHGLSLAEIGRRMHMSPQGIGRHIKRAMQDLEAAMSAAEAQDQAPGAGS